MDVTPLWFVCCNKECSWIKENSCPRSFLRYVEGSYGYNDDGMTFTCKFGVIQLTTHSDMETNNYMYPLRDVQECNPCKNLKRNDKIWSLYT